jgi:hypothetical protein
MTCVSTHLHHAIRIARTVEPRAWPSALEQLQPEARPECEQCLRDLAQRMRAMRRSSIAAPRSVG